MGAGELNAWGNPHWMSIPSKGEVEILLIPSCYRNHDIDKLEPDGLLNLFLGL